MIDGKKVLAIVPARGGSKGIPKKNIIDVNGKPLIAYTLEEAKKSKYIDQIVVSTDDQKIKEVSDRYGDFVPFMRPAELATDEAKTIDVVLHVIEELPDYDLLILLQPTSPLRRVEHIDEAFEKLIESGKDSLVSLTKVKKHPNWMFYVDDKGNMVSVTGEEIAHQRQALREAYVLNGAIYISNIDFIKEKRSMFNLSSFAYRMAYSLSMDIDDSNDIETIINSLEK